MVRNTDRFDLSDRLIHFFRRIDLEKSDAPLVPESFGFGNRHEDTKLSALFMLRCAIRHGRLWATWAYRNNIRTIYGSRPAVCFTEMPIAAFLEASKTRESRGEMISQFALIFEKAALFKLGANPVIYGLDDRKAKAPSGKGGLKRILSERLLPIREQYRYVTYNPTSQKPIDWSHEREWRWPYCGDPSSDADNIPGLELNNHDLQDIGVVVKTAEQAQWVTHDILSLVDQNIIRKDHYSFILCSSKLPTDRRLRDPDKTEDAIRGSMVDFSPYFSITKQQATMYDAQFSNFAKDVERAYPKVVRGERGGAWLWFLDNTHNFTRGLLKSGRMFVTKDRRYLAHLREFKNIRGLKQREIMIKKLSKIITAEYGVETGCFSVLDSNDFNGVPFYCEDKLDNQMFYNASWD